MPSGNPVGGAKSNNWYWYLFAWWGYPAHSYSWGGAADLADHEWLHGNLWIMQHTKDEETSYSYWRQVHAHLAAWVWVPVNG